MRNDYNIRLNFHVGKLMICLGLFCLCPHIIYADDSIPGEEVDVFMQAVEKTARRENLQLKNKCKYKCKYAIIS